jgi:hypothetical protein
MVCQELAAIQRPEVSPKYRSRLTPGKDLENVLVLSEVESVITAAELTLHTVKDLAEMAKKKKIPGWRSMRKQQLIEALLSAARKEARQRKNKQRVTPARSSKTTKGQNSSGNGKVKRKQAAVTAREASVTKSASRSSSSVTVGRSPTQEVKTSHRRVKVAPLQPEVQKQIAELRSQIIDQKDLASTSRGGALGTAKDRLVLMVRDPYWLQAYWEIGPQTVERARAALGQNWHLARPILRVWEVRRDGTSHVERIHLRDIEIHGRVNNWYVNVDQPPRSFEVDIGYVTPDAKFFCLTRSNIVTTPIASAAGPDLDWAVLADEYERVYALSGGYDETIDTSELREVLEDRLRRPLGGSVIQRLGAGVEGQVEHRSRFAFHVDAELVVFGHIHPGYQVSIRGEPVAVGPDGRFSLRLPLPDRRHVLPVVGQSPDGTEQRTIVLAVERNTKVMEPLSKEAEVQS